MKTNFINRAGRTYLVANPDNYGNGTDLGYYRELSFGGYRAVLIGLYHFETPEEAQEWLKQRSDRH